MSRTRFRYSYTVARDGTPDVSTVQLRLELQPLLDELARRDRSRAEEAARQLNSDKARAVAAVLLKQRTQTQTPEQYEGKICIHRAE